MYYAVLFVCLVCMYYNIIIYLHISFLQYIIHSPFTYAADQDTEDPNMNFEQQFYNGLTKWQDEVETLYESTDGTPTSVLREDASKVREFYIGDGSYTRLEWPNQLTNFEDSTCTMNAAMCCWPKDRQGMSHVCVVLLIAMNVESMHIICTDCSHHVYFLLFSFLIS